jgi:opacity protein-like surface antigen
MRRADTLHLLAFLATVLTASFAAAQTTPDPPPNSLDYFQYGVAVASETVGSAADICPEDAEPTPCILGSGGGMAIRVAYRSRGPWLVGGAYEFSRHDSSNLLRLAILQQLRAEARYYADPGTRLTPYLAVGAGAALYGSEWGASTGGLLATLGGGLEFQITQSTVVGFAPMYRALLLRKFQDSAGQGRADRYFGFGLAHLIGLELVFEVREPLPRW